MAAFSSAATLMLLMWGSGQDFVLTSPCPEALHSGSTSWLEDIIPDNYSLTVPPGRQLPDSQSHATKVLFKFTPESVMSLSATKMEFEVDMDVNIYWRDPKLEIPNHLEDSELNERTELPPSVALRLWFPDLSYSNCKGCPPNIIDPGLQRFRIKPSIKELYVRNSKPTVFNCLFDLSNYPFDAQHCKIRIKKYGIRADLPFTSSSLDIVPMADNAEVTVPPEFRLIDITSKNCSNVSRSYTECIEFWFGFQRIMTQHIMLVYIPSVLIVVLSWISFWLDVEVSAPRVALGLTSLLTLSTQFNNAQNNLPPVATVKALDVWMFACMFMVFASLLEFAAANFWIRHIKPFRAAKVTPKPNPVLSLKYGTKHVLRLSGRVRSPAPHEKKNSQAPPIDVASRIAFPVFFIVFNIVYWGYYGSK